MKRKKPSSSKQPKKIKKADRLKEACKVSVAPDKKNCFTVDTRMSDIRRYLDMVSAILPPNMVCSSMADINWNLEDTPRLMLEKELTVLRDIKSIRDNTKKESKNNAVRSNIGQCSLDLHLLNRSVVSNNVDMSRRELIGMQSIIFDVRLTPIQVSTMTSAANMGRNISGLKRDNLQVMKIVSTPQITCNISSSHVFECRRGDQRHIAAGPQFARNRHQSAQKRANDGITNKVNSITKTLHSLNRDNSNLHVEGDVCRHCNVNLIMLYREAILTCPNCARMVPHVNNSTSNLPFGEEPEISKHVYERRKNFKSWMMQWKEGVRIPRIVMERIMTVFSKLMIWSKKEYRVTTVKEILSQLGLTQYMEYAQRITFELCGTPVPSFTQEDIAVFLKLFDLMQAPFMHVKDPLRQSFPNGKYLTSKFCKILGLQDLADSFPLLKSQHNLARQDDMWARMCAVVGVPFERSL